MPKPNPQPCSLAADGTTLTVSAGDRSLVTVSVRAVEVEAGCQVIASMANEQSQPWVMSAMFDEPAPDLAFAIDGLIATSGPFIVSVEIRPVRDFEGNVSGSQALIVLKGPTDTIAALSTLA